MAADRSRRAGAYAPRAAGVETGSGGAPVTVDGRTVEAVREEWLVEDRWWTEKPLRRHYFELVLAGGHNLVVFRSLPGGGWHSQRA